MRSAVRRAFLRPPLRPAAYHTRLIRGGGLGSPLRYHVVLLFPPSAVPPALDKDPWPFPSTGTASHRDQKRRSMEGDDTRPTPALSGRETWNDEDSASVTQIGPRLLRRFSPRQHHFGRLRQAARGIRRRPNPNPRFGARCFNPTPHVPFMRQRADPEPQRGREQNRRNHFCQ